MTRPGILLTASFLALAASASVLRADLCCDESTVTLGEVKAGRPLSQRFTFTNRGPVAVEITAVQPSCGCLKPRLEERRLRAGGSAVLLLEVNTLTAAPGPNAWRVQILYQCDGQTKDLTLLLRATVVSEITIQPAALVLQTESAIEHEITLTDTRANPLTVTGLRTTAPDLQATLRQTHRDGAGRKVFDVAIAVQPGFPPGRYDETLQIFTSDAAYPELRVPVTVVKHARSAVTATPAQVTMNIVSGASTARVVLLRAAEGQEVDIQDVGCDDPAVQCTRAKGPGSMSTLRIQIDGSKLSGDGLRTALRVRLARPVAETLVVPIQCSVR